jgi:ornithine cyclodeaminase/alanine dehydrogenase-like protein (mu-crystallin family)
MRALKMNVIADGTILTLATYEKAIAAIERSFQGSCQPPARQHYDLPGTDRSKLLVMPAWDGREILGVKVATIVPSNASRNLPTINGLYILFDGETGSPTAVMSAKALTSIRTAAVSALASRYLSRRSAKTLLMIGTGALAPHLVKAHATVRQIETVLIWGRRRDQAERVKAELAAADIPSRVTDRLSEAMAQADIICTATPSCEPLVLGKDVAPGTHVDLVGSFTPEMREADAALFWKGRLVVDTRDGFEESGDLLQAVAAQALSAESTTTLHHLVTTPSLARSNDKEITIFKSVGTGLSDLALARLVQDLSLSKERDRV